MGIWPRMLSLLLSSHSQKGVKVPAMNSSLCPIKTHLSWRHSLQSGGRGDRKDDKASRKRWHLNVKGPISFYDCVHVCEFIE